MTKIVVAEDCGNSPKNTFVMELVKAMAKGNARHILTHATEDVRWNRVGEGLIEGKAALADSFANAETVHTLTIKHVATHGKAGAVDGELKLVDGTTRAFCHMFMFENAKGERVREMTSYVIEI